MTQNSNSVKRKLFCYFFLKLGNIHEAGIKAGFPEKDAYIEGIKTLELPTYRTLLTRISETIRQPPVNFIQSGLERLAFGSTNDCIKLMLSDEPLEDSEIDRLNLFNVSEIKRVKGGGLELKFFDRQKALEKMFEFANSSVSSNSALSLIEALSAPETFSGIDTEADTDEA